MFINLYMRQTQVRIFVCHRQYTKCSARLQLLTIRNYSLLSDIDSSFWLSRSRRMITARIWRLM